MAIFESCVKVGDCIAKPICGKVKKKNTSFLNDTTTLVGIYGL